MKLCPQCDFIYEDNQRCCDMDGKELVHEPAAVVNEQSVASQTSRTILSPRSVSKRLTVLAIAGVVLATFISTTYFTQSHRWSATDSDQAAIQSSEQTTAIDKKSEPSLDSLQPPAEASPEQPTAESSSSPTDVVDLASDLQAPELRQSPSAGVRVVRARLASSPVAAAGLNGRDQNPVIVRLTNGAIIRADEVWETKEGVWYRQAGMVTFLKRSRVRTVERPAASNPQPKSTDKSDKGRMSENMIAQNRLRIPRLEAANPKKQSPVKSFLKRTGRILKKPFQF